MIMWLFWIINGILLTELIFFLVVRYDGLPKSSGFFEHKILSLIIGFLVSLINNICFLDDKLNITDNTLFNLKEGTVITIEQLIKYEFTVIGIIVGSAIVLYLFFKMNKILYKFYGGK